jgi:hypothetical protein
METDLEGYKTETFEQSPVYPLMPLLRAGILHRTSVDGFRGIYKTGKILSNSGGRFPETYPQTKASYGFSIDCISLFDFESAREEDYRRTYHFWGGFFSDCKPITIIFKLDRQQLAQNLIPNSERPLPDEKEHKLSIPYVEVWYPGEIPYEAIDSYIVTRQSYKFHEIAFRQFSKGEEAELHQLLSLPIEELIELDLKSWTAS